MISAPDGTPAYTGDSALTILVGAPRSYELEPVDTSGWAAGIYTVTVELLDANEIDAAYERMLKSDVKYRFVIDTATM